MIFISQKLEVYSNKQVSWLLSQNDYSSPLHGRGFKIESKGFSGGCLMGKSSGNYYTAGSINFAFNIQKKPSIYPPS